MPTYAYVCENDECKNFGKDIDIIKPYELLDRKEKCESCKKVLTRKFGVGTNINRGTISGYTYQEREMGFGKKEKRITEIKGEQTVAYAYKCLNKDCGKFLELVEVYKKMTESEAEEFCEECQSKLLRVFSCSYMWGRGSRPDSDRRKEQMVEASNRDDYTKMAELQKNYDSTGRAYFADVKKEKDKKIILKNDFDREYEYYCDNEDCEDYNKTVYVKKKISQSDRKEKCKKCKQIMCRVFGLGGFSFSEK